MYNPSHSFDFLKSWFSLWAQSWKVLDTPQSGKQNQNQTFLLVWVVFHFPEQKPFLLSSCPFSTSLIKEQRNGSDLFLVLPPPSPPPEQQSWSCGRSWVWCAWYIFCGWEEDHEAGWDLEDHSLFHSFFSPATRPVGGACLKWAWIQIFRDILSAVCHCGTLMPNYFKAQKPCLKIGSIWNLPLFVPSNFCCRNSEIIKPEQSHKGNVTHVLFAKLLEMLKASCCHTAS